jgi:hypothetical protein
LIRHVFVDGTHGLGPRGWQLVVVLGLVPGNRQAVPLACDAGETAERIASMAIVCQARAACVPGFQISDIILIIFGL